MRNDEGSLYYVCPRGADSHSLAMVQRERVFPHECGGTHAPLRVSYRRTSAGIGSGAVWCRSGEFTSPRGGVKPPLHQTAPLPGIRMRDPPVVECPHILLVIPALGRCR